ncbi:hypothetical protein Q7C36_018831 [Tachysurus vachellii]|uniref:Uncharacterized protein n=1 Tax=Tachysurus vachellii TaxID=175792 RepID=A0AA88LVD0_TACVA|nr:hypothetical protein Q7C36_018831 [Tachysurus vachellii]
MWLAAIVGRFDWSPHLQMNINTRSTPTASDLKHDVTVQHARAYTVEVQTLKNRFFPNSVAPLLPEGVA